MFQPKNSWNSTRKHAENNYTTTVNSSTSNKKKIKMQFYYSQFSTQQEQVGSNDFITTLKSTLRCCQTKRVPIHNYQWSHAVGFTAILLEGLIRRRRMCISLHKISLFTSVTSFRNRGTYPIHLMHIAYCLLNFLAVTFSNQLPIKFLNKHDKSSARFNTVSTF